MDDWKRVLAFVHLCAVALCAQQTGEIRGVVVDAQGKTVADAVVECRLIDNRPFVGVLPKATTDKDGKFSIVNLMPGEYKLYPAKEKDGYPNLYWGVYDGASGTQITVGPLAPVEGLVLVLGQKAAILSGTVVDAVTNQPISHVIVHLWRTDRAGSLGFGQESSLRVLLPTGVPVGISIQSPGYQEWFYKGISESSGVSGSTFGPTEELRMNLKLTPTVN